MCMSAPAAPSPTAAATRIAKHLYQITHQHFFTSFDDWLALAVNAFLRDDNAYNPSHTAITIPSRNEASASGQRLGPTRERRPIPSASLS